MTRRFVSFAIVPSIVVSAFAATAAADDRVVCFDLASPPATAIIACSTLISSGKLDSHDLAVAYKHRSYFYVENGASDRALADLSEAIRLDQNGSVWSFLLSTNWAIFIAAVGAAVGWYLTYRGWAVNRQSNTELERQKYQNAIDLEKRKAKLNFVSDQIRFLYGPLMALCTTRRAAFDELMALHGQTPDGKGRRSGFFDYSSERTPEELRQWRLWRTDVLMPLVEKMHESILQSAHLIEQETKPEPNGETKSETGGEILLPASFVALMKHVANYKAVIKNWADIIKKDEKDDETGIPKIDAQQRINGKWMPLIPHTARYNFPEEILGEVEDKLKRLKRIQKELIEEIQA